LLGFTTVARLSDLVTSSAAEVIAVDIPIGLPDKEGTRRCDVEVRKVLRPFGSRVFPAPVRATLPYVDDYPGACAESRRTCGKALSKQAWHILDKIAEADELADDPRLHECHPEAAFALMGDGVIGDSKKTPGGRAERLRRLRIWLPDISDGEIPRGDDALDALACAWSAMRYATGAARSWPQGDPPADARRRPMRIIA
jgi:predicted RNase H-like nuclease